MSKVLSVRAIMEALAAQKLVDFDTGSLHLIKTDIPITRESLAADLDAEEADFSGYSSQAVALWAAPYRDGEGNVYMEGPSKLFSHNGGVDDNMIFGWYFKSPVGAGAKFVCGEKYDTPVAMTPLNSGHIVQPLCTIPISE